MPKVICRMIEWSSTKISTKRRGRGTPSGENSVLENDPYIKNNVGQACHILINNVCFCWNTYLSGPNRAQINPLAASQPASQQAASQPATFKIAVKG